MKRHTTLCIAHRLSTIENADQIVVLDDGAVVEVGSHTDLLKMKGVYWSLWETQHNTNNGSCHSIGIGNYKSIDSSSDAAGRKGIEEMCVSYREIE